MKTRRHRRRRVVSRRRRSNPRRRVIRRRRRSSTAVVVRRRRRRRSPVMAVARRSRRSGIVRHRRRRSRSGGIRLGGLNIRQLFDRPTLTIAGGAVASGFLTGFILQKFGGAQAGFSLPGSSTPYGQIAYQIAIPFGAAYLVRKYSPNLARGMILGGIIAAIQSGLSIAMSGSSIAGTGAYLSQPMGALPPGYSAVDAFGASIYSSQPAFAESAWAN